MCNLSDSVRCFEPQIVEDQNVDRYDDMLVELEIDSINYEEFLVNLQNFESKPVLERINFETVSSDIQPLVILEFQEPQLEWMKISREPESDKDDDIGDKKPNETKEEAESLGEPVDEVLCKELRETPISMVTTLDEIEEPIQRFSEIDAEFEEPTREWFQLKDVLVAQEEEEEELEATENVQAMTENENKDITTEKARPIADFEDQRKDKGDVDQKSTHVEPAVEDEFTKDEKVEHVLPQETKKIYLQVEEIESTTDDKQFEQPINNVIPLEHDDTKDKDVVEKIISDESSDAAKPKDEPSRVSEDKGSAIVTSEVDPTEDGDVDQPGELTVLAERTTQYPQLSIMESEMVVPKGEDSDQVVSSVDPEQEDEIVEQTVLLPGDHRIQLTGETLQPEIDPVNKEIDQLSTKVDLIGDDDGVEVEEVDDVLPDETVEAVLQLQQTVAITEEKQIQQPINNVFPLEEHGRKDDEMIEETGSDNNSEVIKPAEEPSETTEDKVFDIITSKVDPTEDDGGDGHLEELTVFDAETNLYPELSTNEPVVAVPDEKDLEQIVSVVEPEQEHETSEQTVLLPEYHGVQLTAETLQPEVDPVGKNIDQLSTNVDLIADANRTEDGKVEHGLPEETKEFALPVQEMESTTDDKQFEQPINNVIPLEHDDTKDKDVVEKIISDESSDAAKPKDEPSRVSEDKGSAIVTSEVDPTEDGDVDQPGELTVLAERTTQYPQLSIMESEMVVPKGEDSDQVVSSVDPEQEDEIVEQTVLLPGDHRIQLTGETLQPEIDPVNKEIDQLSTKVDLIGDDDGVEVEEVDDVLPDETVEAVLQLQQTVAITEEKQIQQPINNVFPLEEHGRKDDEMIEETGSDNNSEVIKPAEEPSETTEDKVFDIITSKVDPTEDDGGDGHLEELTVFDAETNLYPELSTNEPVVAVPDEKDLEQIVSVVEPEQEHETSEQTVLLPEYHGVQLTAETLQPEVDPVGKNIDQLSTNVDLIADANRTEDGKVEHGLPEETKEFALPVQEMESTTDDKQFEQPINNVIPLEHDDTKDKDVVEKIISDESSDAAKPKDEPSRVSEDKGSAIVTSEVDPTEDGDVDQPGELTVLAERTTQYPQLSIMESEMVVPKGEDSDQVVSSVDPEQEDEIVEQTVLLPGDHRIQLTGETLQPEIDPVNKEIDQLSTKVDLIGDDDGVEVEEVDDVLPDETVEAVLQLQQTVAITEEKQIQQPINNVFPLEEHGRKDDEMIEETGSDNNSEVIKPAEEPSETTEDKVFDIITSKVDPTEDDGGDGHLEELTVFDAETNLYPELSTNEPVVAVPDEKDLEQIVSVVEPEQEHETSEQTVLLPEYHGVQLTAETLQPEVDPVGKNIDQLSTNVDLIADANRTEDGKVEHGLPEETKEFALPVQEMESTTDDKQFEQPINNVIPLEHDDTKDKDVVEKIISDESSDAAKPKDEPSRVSEDKGSAIVTSEVDPTEDGDVDQPGELTVLAERTTQYPQLSIMESEMVVPKGEDSDQVVSSVDPEQEDEIVEQTVLLPGDHRIQLTGETLQPEIDPVNKEIDQLSTKVDLIGDDDGVEVEEVDDVLPDETVEAVLQLQQTVAITEEKQIQQPINNVFPLEEHGRKDDEMIEETGSDNNSEVIKPAEEPSETTEDKVFDIITSKVDPTEDDGGDGHLEELTVFDAETNLYPELSTNEPVVAVPDEKDLEQIVSVVEPEQEHETSEQTVLLPEYHGVQLTAETLQPEVDPVGKNIDQLSTNVDLIADANRTEDGKVEHGLPEETKEFALPVQEMESTTDDKQFEQPINNVIPLEHDDTKDKDVVEKIISDESSDAAKPKDEPSRVSEDKGSAIVTSKVDPTEDGDVDQPGELTVLAERTTQYPQLSIMESEMVVPKGEDSDQVVSSVDPEQEDEIVEQTVLLPGDHRIQLTGDTLQPEIDPVNKEIDQLSTKVDLIGDDDGVEVEEVDDVLPDETVEAVLQLQQTVAITEEKQLQQLISNVIPLEEHDRKDDEMIEETGSDNNSEELKRKQESRDAAEDKGFCFTLFFLRIFNMARKIQRVNSFLKFLMFACG